MLIFTPKRKVSFRQGGSEDFSRKKLGTALFMNDVDFYSEAQSFPPPGRIGRLFEEGISAAFFVHSGVKRDIWALRSRNNWKIKRISLPLPPQKFFYEND